MLAGLAWRNIWRQPHRTALSLISITVAGAATIFLFSLQQGAYGTMKESVLRLIDGFAQVQPPGYSKDPDLRKNIADPRVLMASLDKLPHVQATAPRAMSYAILSRDKRSYAGAVIGIDPGREAEISDLASTITAGRYLRPSDSNAAVVGVGLAQNLKLSVGDKLTMLGAARDGSVAADVLNVVGIFSTGAPEIDRQLIEMPLSQFQSDFAMGDRVNLVAVSGHRLSDIQSSLSAIRSAAQNDKLVVRDWAELEPALHDVILLDISISLLIYTSLIVIVVFIILNTLLMSVLERTREFGMLMAIGMRPGQIGRMIWFELLFLSGIGAILGIALGSAITLWVAHYGIAFPSAEALFSQWHMPSTLYPQLNALSALAGPLAIAVSIAVAGIVPYLRVLRLTPVPAMRAT
jgi:putative ABC transport system permease protein